MKSFSLILFLLLSITATAQPTNATINQTSFPTTWNRNRGAFTADQYLQLPKRTFNVPFKNVDSLGQMQIDPMDSIPGYFNGRQWRKLVYQSQLNAMLLNYVANSSYTWPMPGTPSTFPPSVHTHQISDVTGLQMDLNDKLNKTDTTGRWYPLNSNPANYLITVPAQTFASLIGKPTTLSGYNITDAYPLTGNPAGFLTQQYSATQGYGIRVTGSGATQTIAVDTNQATSGNNAIMYVGKANGAINGLQNGINSKEPIIATGTTSQYWRGDKTFQTLNTSVVPEGTNQYFTAARFNISFAAKSTTDLLEGINLYFTNARARTSISLTTTGTGASTYNSTTGVLNIPVSSGTAINAPSYNNSITSGTPFQPSATNASQIIISSSLTGGVAGISGTTVIAMSATQNGTYTNIGNGISFLLSALALIDNRDSATIPVPAGYWIRVTNTAVGVGASLTSTYTRWNY